MQKKQKIKANAPSAKNELRYAKMPKLAIAQTMGIFTLHYIHFLNAKFAEAGRVA